MIVNGTAKPREIVETFGVPMVTVKRYMKVYREQGERWTPYVGQLGSQFKVDSAVHVHAAEVSDRVPA